MAGGLGGLGGLGSVGSRVQASAPAGTTQPALAAKPTRLASWLKLPDRRRRHCHPAAGATAVAAAAKPATSTVRGVALTADLLRLLPGSAPTAGLVAQLDALLPADASGLKASMPVALPPQLLTRVAQLLASAGTAAELRTLGSSALAQLTMPYDRQQRCQEVRKTAVSDEVRARASRRAGCSAMEAGHAALHNNAPRCAQRVMSAEGNPVTTSGLLPLAVHGCRVQVKDCYCATGDAAPFWAHCDALLHLELEATAARVCQGGRGRARQQPGLGVRACNVHHTPVLRAAVSQCRTSAQLPAFAPSLPPNICRPCPLGLLNSWTALPGGSAPARPPSMLSRTTATYWQVEPGHGCPPSWAEHAA